MLLNSTFEGTNTPNKGTEFEDLSEIKKVEKLKSSMVEIASAPKKIDHSESTILKRFH
jgi:hypothetical protein